MKKIILSLSLISILNANDTLTLKDCIDSAILTHPDIKSFKVGIESTKIGIKLALSDYLPQIAVSAEYTPQKTVVLPVNGQFLTKDVDGYSASIMLKQKVYDFGKTFNNIEIQELNTKIANMNLKDSKVLLAYKVKLKYELIYFYKSVIKVRSNDLMLKKEYLKQAQAFVKAGMKTKAEESRFLSAVYNSIDNLEIAESDYNKAKNSLSLITAKSITKNTIFVNSMLNNNEINKAIDFINSPSISSLKENIKKTKITTDMLRKNHFGSIDIVANSSYQNSINEYDTSSLGISLNIPLYSGGRISSGIEISKINELKSLYQLEARKLSLLEEYDGLIIDFNKYNKSIKTRNVQIEAAWNTLEATKGRYDSGMATYIEVLDASALYLNSELSLLQANFNKSKTLHRIEYLNGEI